MKRVNKIDYMNSQFDKLLYYLLIFVYFLSVAHYYVIKCAVPLTVSQMTTGQMVFDQKAWHPNVTGTKEIGLRAKLRGINHTALRGKPLETLDR